MYHCDVLLHSYIHKLDPFVIQITETLGLRWYGLSYIGGFFTAWAAIRLMGRRNITLLRPNMVGDFIFACVLGVLIGGRLGYVVFYDPHCSTRSQPTFHGGGFWRFKTGEWRVMAG